MNRAFRFLMIAICSAALLGCATSHVNTEFAQGISADGKKPVAVVTAENYGYYLFGYIPIITGDPDNQNGHSLRFFHDTVTVENNHAMISRELEKLGACTMTDLRDSTFWTGGFSLWIVWRQVLSSNALAIGDEK